MNLGLIAIVMIVAGAGLAAAQMPVGANNHATGALVGTTNPNTNSPVQLPETPLQLPNHSEQKYGWPWGCPNSQPLPYEPDGSLPYVKVWGVNGRGSGYSL